MVLDSETRAFDSLATLKRPVWAAGANGELDPFKLDEDCLCDCHGGIVCCFDRTPEWHWTADGEGCDHAADDERCECWCPCGEDCSECSGFVYAPDLARAAHWSAPPRMQPDPERQARRAAFRVGAKPGEQSALWRLHAGDSQAEVAASMGMGQSSVSKAMPKAKAKVLAAAGLTQADIAKPEPRAPVLPDSWPPCCTEWQTRPGKSGQPCPQHQEMTA